MKVIKVLSLGRVKVVQGNKRFDATDEAFLEGLSDLGWLKEGDLVEIVRGVGGHKIVRKATQTATPLPQLIEKKTAPSGAHILQLSQLEWMRHAPHSSQKLG